MEGKWALLAVIFSLLWLSKEACLQHTPFNQTEGNITSPNYPSFSYGFMSCARDVQVNSSYFKFTVHSLRLPCSDGWLKIMDMMNRTPIANICGIAAPSHDFYSLWSPVRFVFSSRVNNTGVRFKIGYKALPRRCGSSGNGRSGNFSSSNFPLPYPGLINCVWLLPPVPGYRVVLTLRNFSLQSSFSGGCSHNNDSLEIRNTSKTGILIVSRLCKLPVPVRILGFRSSALWVRFHADAIPFPPGLAQSGFFAFYHYEPYPTVAPTPVYTPTPLPEEKDSYSGYYRQLSSCSLLNGQYTIQELHTSDDMACALICQRSHECRSILYESGEEQGKGRCVLFRTSNMAIGSGSRSRSGVRCYAIDDASGL